MPYRGIRDQHIELVRQSSQYSRLQPNFAPDTQYTRLDDVVSEVPNRKYATSDVQPPMEERTKRFATTTGKAPRRRSNKFSIRGFRRRFTVLSENTWTPELSSLLFAIGCVIATVVILRVYDGQSLPDWPYGITLNTLVSVLVTLATFSLMVPLSVGISQLKWVQFDGKEQRMTHLDLFDQASRGPFGSLVMITTQRWSLSSLGALTMILALAANAFTQQSIVYVSKTVMLANDRFTTSPRARWFGSIDLSDQINNETPTWQPDTATEGALLAGVLFGNKIISHVRPTCASANCYWPEYTTLGVCATVADVSEYLLTTCSVPPATCRAELPKTGVPPLLMALDGSNRTVVQTVGLPGLLASAYWVQINPNSDAAPVTSIAFRKNLVNSLADFYVLKQWPEQVAQAVEVNLQYCVQTLESGVEKGHSWTSVKKWYTDFDFHGPPIMGNNLTAVLPDSGELFEVGQESWGAMANYTVSQFAVDWRSVGYSSQPGRAFSLFAYPNPAIKAIINAIFDATDKKSALKALEIFANNVAISLTNHFRTSDNTTSPALGSIYSSQNFVSVSWAWITLLAFITGATAVFIVSVIVATKRARCKLWKDSTVAVLQALDSDARPNKLDGLRDRAAMTEDAEHTTLRLQWIRGRWKLVPTRQSGDAIL